MARNFNLFTSIKRSVTNALKLLGKSLRTANKQAPSPTSQARPKRPKPPKVTPAPEAPTNYERAIEELQKKLEEQNAEIERLKQELYEAKQDVIEKPLDFGPDDLPYGYKEPEEAPEPVEYSEDDLPYEIKDEDPVKEPIDTTYKNFGSDESINTLLDFLNDTNLSGIDPNSPFFQMDPIDRKFVLLDYVQFQHDSNPALFYKGRRSLALENVPIWGSEFDRYVENAYNFDNIQNDGNKSIDLGWMDDILTDI